MTITSPVFHSRTAKKPSGDSEVHRIDSLGNRRIGAAVEGRRAVLAVGDHPRARLDAEGLDILPRHRLQIRASIGLAQAEATQGLPVQLQLLELLLHDDHLSVSKNRTAKGLRRYRGPYKPGCP